MPAAHPRIITIPPNPQRTSKMPTPMRATFFTGQYYTSSLIGATGELPQEAEPLTASTRQFPEASGALPDATESFTDATEWFTGATGPFTEASEPFAEATEPLRDATEPLRDATGGPDARNGRHAYRMAGQRQQRMVARRLPHKNTRRRAPFPRNARPTRIRPHPRPLHPQQRPRRRLFPRIRRHHLRLTQKGLQKQPFYDLKTKPL